MTIRSLHLTLALVCSLPGNSFGHGGGLNAEGCHTQKSNNNYHCHQAARSNEQNSAQPKNEAYFNEFLASKLGGHTEVIVKYDFDSVSQEKLYGSIRIDIVTAEQVIEGGLDTRGSLDSLQQAIFASVLTDKRPAIAIYDTDGAWGKIEHRVLTAAKRSGVAFYWVHSSEIQRLN